MIPSVVLDSSHHLVDFDWGLVLMITAAFFKCHFPCKVSTHPRRSSRSLATTYWPVLPLHGKLEPINNGYLDIFVSESEVDCEPVEEDVDGDLVQDGWEVGNYGVLPSAVSARHDPEGDGVRNNIEFALATDPHFKTMVVNWLSRSMAIGNQCLHISAT